MSRLVAFAAIQGGYKVVSQVEAGIRDTQYAIGYYLHLEGDGIGEQGDFTTRNDDAFQFFAVIELSPARNEKRSQHC